MTAFAAAGALAILSAMAWAHVQGFGFPDGHLTDLQRAEKARMPVFVVVNLIAASWFTVLGWLAARRSTRAMLTASAVVYILLMIGLMGVDAQWRGNLNAGGGG